MNGSSRRPTGDNPAHGPCVGQVVAQSDTTCRAAQDPGRRDHLASARRKPTELVDTARGAINRFRPRRLPGPRH